MCACVPIYLLGVTIAHYVLHFMLLVFNFCQYTSIYRYQC